MWGTAAEVPNHRWFKAIDEPHLLFLRVDDDLGLDYFFTTDAPGAEVDQGPWPECWVNRYGPFTAVS